MAYKALYNKYRPQTFEEVAGQRSIVRTLKNAITSGKIAHAYLFCGPRGTGKTTMARLFAKALNCEEGIGHQCNQCSNCLAVMEGSHPDVVEIDAASNNGVDQVRDLIEKVRYAPLKGRYKVYIIDEVHMMTPGAFNALLKTLEEPPDHVIFILATTEPYKVLPTILSRCQRFDFEKIEPEDIREKLLWILDQEKVQYDEAGIEAIISLADGGMRDALSILDQVLAYSGNKLQEADVLSLFGLTSNAQKIDLLKMVRRGDVAAVLAKLEEFLGAGIDIKRLTINLLDILKDLIVYEKTHEESLLTTLSEKQAQDLEPLIEADYANRMIGILLKAQIDFKSVSNIRSLFELTLLQLCALSDNPVPVAAPKVAPAPEIKKPVVTEKAAIPEPQIVQPEPKKVETSPLSQDTPPSFLFEDDSKKKTPEPVVEAPIIQEETAIDTSSIKHSEIANEGEDYKLSDDTVVSIMVLGNKEERYQLTKKWASIEALKTHPKLGNLAVLLSEGHPFCLCQEALLLTYNFTRLRNKANIKENQKAIADMIEKILGRRVFVYALDRIDAHKYQDTYFSLLQLNKLPNKKDITLDLPKGE